MGKDAWDIPGWRWGSPFFSLSLVGFLGRLSYEMARSPLTPLYALHLGAPKYLIGLIVAAVTITGIVVKLPSGALSDLFGFRPLMKGGAIVKATAPFIYLVAGSWPFLLVIRLYHGLATALYAPPASALVARVYPKERASRLGAYSAAENAGVVLGPVVGGAVLSATSFPLAFAASGAIGIGALAALTGVPKDAYTGPPAEGRKDGLGQAFSRLWTGVREIASDPQIRLVSLVEGALWLGIGSLQAYLPIYALAVRIPVFEIGLLAGAQGVASVVSRPLMGRWSDRVGRRPLMVAGSLLAGASVALVPHFTAFAPLLILAAVFGLGTGLVTPSSMAMIADLVRKGNYGSAMGVFGSLWDTGHAAGPVIFGLLLTTLGYRTSWLLMALVMLASLIPFLIGTKPLHRTT